MDADTTRHIATMLACPHSWGAERDVRIVDPSGGEEPRNAQQWTCSACGTHKLRYTDGSGALVSPAGLTETPIL